VGDPDSPLSVFAAETGEVRRRAMAIFEEALADQPFPEDLKALLAPALWLLLLGALLYFIHDRSPAQEKTHALVDGMLEAVIPLAALASSPLMMGALVVLAGLPIAPLIASRNQLVDRIAPAGTATEAFTWPLTALIAGVSLGAAVAGGVIESSSWSVAVLVAIGVSLAGATIVLLRRHTLVQPLAA